MGNPFIYLFKSPNKNYCFDVNTDQLIEISSELYNMLYQWVIEEDNPKAEIFSNKEYERLTAKGLLQDFRPQKIEHPLSQHLETYLERGLKLIVLQITQDCNFRCKYCSYTSGVDELQRKHTKKKMSWKIAKESIDYLVTHSIDEVMPGVSFYGGEPLLEFDLMKKIVAYTEERFGGRDVLFNTTVNGSLLTPEICNFLQEHHFKLLVSLDGTKAAHDKNRVFAENGKGTFDIVLKKLEMIVKQFPELAENTTVNMVVDNQATDVVFDLCKLYPLIFPAIGARGTFIDNTYLEDKSQDLKTSESLARRYILQEALSILSLLGKDFGNDLAFISKEALKRTLFSVSGFSPRKKFEICDAPAGPCVPGADRLFVTYDGKLFPCERVSEINDDICLGHIETGVSYTKAYHFLNVAQSTQEKCLNCFAFRHCNVCGRVLCTTEIGFSKLQNEACQNAKSNCVFLLKMKALLQEALEIYDKTVVW